MINSILEQLSDEELYQMIDELNMFSIPNDALIRKVAMRCYNTEEEYVVHMIGLAAPIATEIVKRIRNS